LFPYDGYELTIPAPYVPIKLVVGSPINEFFVSATSYAKNKPVVLILGL
jgi:hypothetical protein